MSSFLNPFEITIQIGVATLSQPSFRALIIGTGSAEIPYQLVTKESWQTALSNVGYASTDPEYKMCAAFFAQNPSPSDVVVYRKLNGTSYTDALNALVLTFSDFWGVLATSDTLADQNEIGNWVASRAFGLNLNRTDTVSVSSSTSYKRFIAHDKLKTSGYQEISSSPLPFVSSTVHGISDATYDLDITVDGGSLHQLSVSVTTTDTWNDLAGDIQTALRAETSGNETVEITPQGKIKVTSESTGSDSSVLIEAGTAGSGGGDLLAAIDGLTDYETTIEGAVNGKVIYPDAALMGRKLPFAHKGWGFKELSGIPATGYTTTQLSTAKSNNLLWVQSQYDSVYTQEPEPPESGMWIDVRYIMDYTKVQLEMALLQLELQNEDVPFDNTGIALVEEKLRGVFSTLGGMGIVAKPVTKEDQEESDLGDYMYKLNVPARSGVPELDRAARLLSGITWSAVLAGSIYKFKVNGKFTA